VYPLFESLIMMVIILDVNVVNPLTGLAVNPQGYYVITPFKRTDGTIVFINRGWVAMKETNWLRPSGVTTLSTVVSHPEKENTFTPVNNPASMKLLWVEADALRICAETPQLKLNEIVVLEAFEKDDVPVTSYPAAKRQKHLDQQVYISKIL
jgi:cytochrome oxidase assembly protein ShyY1